MAKKDLSKRDRELYERLRAKGIGKKLARRIAGAPEVDGGKGGKGARKAAKKAMGRLEDRWAAVEAQAPEAAESPAPDGPGEAQGSPASDALRSAAIDVTTGAAADAAGGGDPELVRPDATPQVRTPAPAGGALREAVQAAGATPRRDDGSDETASGAAPEEEEVLETASATPGLQSASGAIEADVETGDEGAVTSGVTAGGMDVGVAEPIEDEGEGTPSAGVPVDETLEAAETSAEDAGGADDATGGQECQGGGDGDPDDTPEAASDAES